MTDVFYMQIIGLGMLVLAAHFGGKIARRLKIGEVVGQVVGGLVVGPILLFLIEHRYPAYRQGIESLHFFTFVFLSIIAFGIGDELLWDKLKKTGKDVFIICFTQAFCTWALLTGVFLWMGFKPINAFIIGSIGIATAPAVTFVIMNKLDIVGKMRNMLGGIVVLDDVVEIIIFSIACQVAILLQQGKELTLNRFLLPITEEFLFAALIGVGIFLALRLMVERKWLQPKNGQGRSTLGPEFLSRLISEMPGPSVEVLVLVAGTICVGVGAALHFNLPFLITAVVAGVLISNLYSRHVFDSLRIENATSMYTLVFFALIGANAKLEAFTMDSILYIGAYIVCRAVGKIGGTWLGCKLTKQEPRFTQCLPKLMLPQAGVAAVEAYYVATVLGDDGAVILSIILPGLIVFEIAGVLTSERALLKWRSWTTGGGELIGEEDVIRDSLEKEKLHAVDFLKAENLMIPLDVHSKGEAIWELLRTHRSVGHIENPGEILQIILEREKQGGTALGDGIVILHGRINKVDEPAVIMGIIPSDREVVFGGPGDEPARVVFLVISPSDKPERHLQYLAAIANFLGNPETRKKLVAAEDDYEALEVIREAAG